MRLMPVVCGLLWLAATACDGSAPLQRPSNPLFPIPPGVVLGGPSGAYTVMLTASPSCALVRDSVSGQMLPFPDSVRVRRYEGEFADGEGRLTAPDSRGAHVGGIDSYIYNGPMMFVKGTELTIVTPGDTSGRFGGCAGGDYWWEELSGLPGTENFFELCGTWRGSMEDPARIQGTIDGAFVLHQGYAYNTRLNQFCGASDHQFEMIRH